MPDGPDGERGQQLVMADRDLTYRTVPTTVRTAAAETGFYRIGPTTSGREGHDPEAVEKALSGVEGLLPARSRTWSTGVGPSLEDRFRIALLVAI